ncbi:MAG: hypothetical protein KDI19_08985, partial [Pseudomonadales bacterium]|nr:hypothetical protein [Pseudomonadales bacterium]
CATHPEPDALDAGITGALQEAGVDLVVSAGYMKKLGPRTLETFRGRIVNIHPSLLPRHGGQGMYGERVHQAVLDSGDTETGITVHYVDADYDTGPIITQVRVPVVPGDTVQTLSRRILELEHRLIVDTLGELSKNDKNPAIRALNS